MSEIDHDEHDVIELTTDPIEIPLPEVPDAANPRRFDRLRFANYSITMSTNIPYKNVSNPGEIAARLQTVMRSFARNDDQALSRSIVFNGVSPNMILQPIPITYSVEYGKPGSRGARIHGHVIVRLIYPYSSTPGQRISWMLPNKSWPITEVLKDLGRKNNVSISYVHIQQMHVEGDQYVAKGQYLDLVANRERLRECDEREEGKLEELLSKLRIQ